MLTASFQVNPGNDDNVGIGANTNDTEIVGIQFDRGQRVYGFTLRDAEHWLYNEDDQKPTPVLASIDVTFDSGITWETVTTAGNAGYVDLTLTAGGARNVSSSDIIGFSYKGKQFYVRASRFRRRVSSALVWLGLAFMGSTVSRKRESTGK